MFVRASRPAQTREFASLVLVCVRERDRVCVCACVCMRACVRACVHACCMCVSTLELVRAHVVVTRQVQTANGREAGCGGGRSRICTIAMSVGLLLRRIVRDGSACARVLQVLKCKWVCRFKSSFCCAGPYHC